jgi:hypothetical protein
VGGYAEWHEVSDHMPLIVDLDLPPKQVGAYSADARSAGAPQ